MKTTSIPPSPSPPLPPPSLSAAPEVTLPAVLTTPAARYNGTRVNWRGLATLCSRESRRFLSIAGQTVIGPVVSALLFLAIFTFALGRSGIGPLGFSYTAFLIPGLVMMSVMQNAFANTSSSLMTAKFQGNIVDLLMPPLGPAEILVGLVTGGVVRGLVVAAVAFLALSAFQPLGLAHPLVAFWFALMASVLLGLLGVLSGLWAEKWEQAAVVTNFVIVPLSFLSGTFYSVSSLPDNWRWLAFWNPFFYMVDGFRYGVLGVHESSLRTGVVLLLAANFALFFALWLLMRRHWRLWD
ncbi:MAG: ABC transporter permease [Alphaproteobacteria bacterium]|nr:ABC transporter permease [Alphaproteobacteria bacterium]MDA7983443.1 ABC transporter permease [Alphaproteobacteria bacterium]MDA7988996.1 ABC transporter permease [Alphaproteobacteria bacterium]MDA8009494.1 ABC transporter permease [Alphaproteobacteria bacterium]